MADRRMADELGLLRHSWSELLGAGRGRMTLDEAGLPSYCPSCGRWSSDSSPRWWKYAVLRGQGIPARLDGQWFDLDELSGIDAMFGDGYTAVLEATNRWEQRDDGAIAVVYEFTGGVAATPAPT